MLKCCDMVTAFTLDLIHGRVSMVNQGINIFTMFREQAQANTSCSKQAVFIYFKRFGKDIQQALC